jgi:hypothetical protein
MLTGHGFGAARWRDGMAIESDTTGHSDRTTRHPESETRMKRQRTMIGRALKAIVAWLGLSRGQRPPGSPRDPYAWTPSRLRPGPSDRTSAVAVAEPED